MVTPRVGGTVVRVTRDAVAEGGNTPFALAVARDRDTIGFVNAGLDFRGGQSAMAVFQPLLSLGARTQVAGQETTAVAGFAGAPLGLVAQGLVAQGAERPPVVATATVGLDARIGPNLRISSALTGEAGDGETRATGTVGLTLRF